MSCGGSKDGRACGEHQDGADGRAIAGNAPSRIPPAQAGDLSNFGKTSKTNSMTQTFGSNGVFAMDKGKGESATLSRGSSSMFSKLMENPELATDVAMAASSRPPSRRPTGSVGSSSAGVPEAPQRRKLFLPRTLPTPDDTGSSTPAPSDVGHSDDEDSGAPAMTEAQVKTRSAEDAKEFFNIRDLDEAEAYLTKLPSENRWLLVDDLVVFALRLTEADAQLVSDYFSRVVSKDLCSPDQLEKGFASIAELLDDIAINVNPTAYNFMALMMKGAQLDRKRCVRLASKVDNSDKLLRLILPNTATPSAQSSGAISRSPGAISA